MAEMLLSDRIEADGITVETHVARPADHGRFEYHVWLHRPDGRSMRLHDYSGPDTPSVLDVMGLLLSVASRVEGSSSYEEWASEFESDQDKWQGPEIYDLQCAEIDKFRDFLGPGTLDAYLYETERDD